jgi:cation diffusion facilitator family transporter
MTQDARDFDLHPASQGMRSTLIGILVNVGLAITKGTAGVLGNSYALVADAIESSFDVISSIIVWSGLRYATRPPDQNHPYGHGKGEPLAATVVALALFGAALGIAFQSVREIRLSHTAPAPFTLGILLLVIFTKETLYRFVFRVGNEVESTAVITDAWHHRSDALTSGAAFVGISVALIGGKGWESADDWAALFASGIIGWNAFRLLRPALLELTDAAPDAAIEARVREVAQAVEGVVGLDKGFVRKMGFDYYVDLDVIVDRSTPVYEAHEIAHRVQDAIRRADARVTKVLVHIEPSDR